MLTPITESFPENAQPPGFIDQTVGLNLRAIRLAAGRTQRDLGNVLGVTLQQIQKYEKGSNRLTLGALLILRQFLDMPLVVFLYGLPPALTGLKEGKTLDYSDPEKTALWYRLQTINDRRVLRQISQTIDILTGT